MHLFLAAVDSAAATVGTEHELSLFTVPNFYGTWLSLDDVKEIIRDRGPFGGAIGFSCALTPSVSVISFIWSYRVVFISLHRTPT